MPVRRIRGFGRQLLPVHAPSPRHRLRWRGLRHLLSCRAASAADAARSAADASPA
ncbi:MAG: hypothetical protein ACK559_10765 [bacterium]